MALTLECWDFGCWRRGCVLNIFYGNEPNLHPLWTTCHIASIVLERTLNNFLANGKSIILYSVKRRSIPQPHIILDICSICPKRQYMIAVPHNRRSQVWRTKWLSNWFRTSHGDIFCGARRRVIELLHTCWINWWIRTGAMCANWHFRSNWIARTCVFSQPSNSSRKVYIYYISATYSWFDSVQEERCVGMCLRVFKYKLYVLW